MKTTGKILASALLVTLSIGSAIAQQDATVTIVPNRNGEDGSAIIKTVGTDLNSEKIAENALGFLKLLPTKWKVTQEQLDMFSGADKPQYFEVMAQSGKDRQVAIYNEKGDIVQYSEIIKDATLPLAATETLGSKYAKWHVKGEKEMINSERNKSDYYKVTVYDGLKRKALFFDLAGNQLNRHLKAVK